MGKAPLPPSLIQHVAELTDEPLELGRLQEQVWVEVIQKMDQVYSDLIRYEIGLEEKNARLEEAQAFITSVLSSMSDVLIVCQQDGRVQEVNQALLDCTGLAVDHLIGKPLEELIAVGDTSALASFSVRPSAAVLRECEVRLRCAGGGVSDVVAMNCSLRLDHRGRPEGTVLIGRPVGELRRAYAELARAHADLKQAQQSLVQQEKMASLGRLVAGVAHELNNPISFVNGNVHSLQKYMARVSEYLGAIHLGASSDQREDLRRRLKIDAILADLPELLAGTLEGAERVTDIVKSLRRLSFSQSGKPEVFDAAAVVQTAMQWTLKGSLVMPEVILALEDGLLVRGQAGQLHQVITNLIQNALDAVEGTVAPRLEICGRKQQDASLDPAQQVVLTVRDSGAGILDEHLLRVFDPFFTTKPVGRGTGLGLWISYGLVRDCGGVLSVANHPDGGALFTISLPAASA